MSAVSAFYYLRVVWYMYFREPEGDAVELEPSGAGVGWAVALSTLGVVARRSLSRPAHRAPRQEAITAPSSAG